MKLTLIHERPTINITFSTNEKVENINMITTNIKMYRGAASHIDVFIKNSDRKSLNTLGKTITAHMTFLENEDCAFVKVLNVIDETKGQYELVLERGEVDSLTPGRYRIVFTIRDLNDTEEMLYSENEYSTNINVEIVTKALPQFRPSTVINNFQLYNNKYYSSAYPGDMQLGFLDGFHTCAMYCTNFSGKVWIQSTLENSIPTQENDWINLLISLTGSYYELTNFTGIEPFNFQIQCQWIRFVYEPSVNNTGTIDKILYRN